MQTRSMALQMQLPNIYNTNQGVDRGLRELIGTKETNNSLLPVCLPEPRPPVSRCNNAVFPSVLFSSRKKSCMHGLLNEIYL